MPFENPPKCENCPAVAVAKMVYDLNRKSLEDQVKSYQVQMSACTWLKLIDITNQKN